MREYPDEANRGGTRRGCAVVLLAGLLLIAVVGSIWASNKAPVVQSADYVALGSSFAAGPGVGRRESGSPLLCARSSSNYPHLLARRLGMTLRDMTCSGATIADVLVDRQARQPPQVEGVDANTRLVTITIGGNDVGYLGNLAAESCANARSRVPILWRTLVCNPMPQDQVVRAFSQLRSRMDLMVKEIRARAPRAKIVLVDYMTVLPPSGGCPDRMPLNPEQLKAANLVAEQLSEVTREVARNAKVHFVAASDITSGHDACASDPWVFPFVFQSIPLVWGPFAYHPNAKAVAAITDAVASAVETGGR